MKKPLIPANEKQRLQNLYNYSILDTGEEEDFNDLVALVSHICSCPVASITFIDKDRQWFKAEKNMLGKEGRRDESFCGHTILEQEMLVVNDAVNDERFFDNPHVTSGLKIGFYAGAPIVSAAGFTLGAVCAIDNVPRQLSQQQCDALKLVAKQVSRLLDLRIKNRQIKETADKLIEAEKKLAQFNITQHDEANFKTAFLLHEDIAQTTAAVKLYMGFAKTSPDMAAKFLDYGIEELGNLTNAITKLSKSLTPTTFMQDNYAAHINQLAADFEAQTKAVMHCRIKGNVNELQGKPGLMLYRIVQDLLRLTVNETATTAALTINTADEILLQLKFDSKQTIDAEKQNLLYANIENRVAIAGGSLTYKRNSGAVPAQIIRIQIPVEKTMVYNHRFENMMQ